MSEFYSRLQGTASRLMRQFNQGTVVYLEPGFDEGPVYDPQPGQPTPHDMDATVSGVAEQYIDGTNITSTDLQVTASVFDVEPTNEGRIEIDGRVHEIIRVNKIPAAGATIAWLIFVKG